MPDSVRRFRRLRRPAHLATLACVALAGCAGASFTPANRSESASPAAWRGDTLRLSLGATVRLADGATLTFAARGDDSRCPVGASCVWEGDAAVAMRLTSGAPAVRTLHTNARVGPDTVAAGGSTLRLVGLVPLPHLGGVPPADSAVRALFVVVRPVRRAAAPGAPRFTSMRSRSTSGRRRAPPTDDPAD